MSDAPKYRCPDCGKPARRRRELGKSLRCKPCGEAAMIANALQLHRHDGPAFDHWRRACAGAVGVVLDDDR